MRAQAPLRPPVQYPAAFVRPSDPLAARRLAAIDAAGLLRRPPVVQLSAPLRGRVEGRDVVVFCSNDYLGLRLHPAVRAGAAAAADEHGGGAGSSRMIAGSLPIHEQLEEAVARWMGTEAALVFPSGYQANLALLQGLGQRGDRLVCDSLNHASLIDGARLCRADVRVVSHGDAAALGDALAVPAKMSGETFFVGEGLYSMDGDRGPVAGWAEAADGAGAHLLVDEAHALGVLGPGGRGASAEAGVADRLLARVGTLGKALGAGGAAIATDRATRELLLNTGRTFIFTTGLVPAAAGAALAGIEIAAGDEGDERRGRLRRLARRVRGDLRSAGWTVLGDEDIPIVPVVVGSADEAMALYTDLLDRGVYAMAIRPPTVPAGTCRVRITLSAAHTDSDVDLLLRAMASPTG